MSICKTPLAQVCYERGIQDAFVWEIPDATIDTFGYSVNLCSFLAFTQGQDFDVSHQELSGSEGQGDPRTFANGIGTWGVNLDTLEEVGSGTIVNVKFNGLTLNAYQNGTAISKVYYNGVLALEL